MEYVTQKTVTLSLACWFTLTRARLSCLARRNDVMWCCLINISSFAPSTPMNRVFNNAKFPNNSCKYNVTRWHLVSFYRENTLFWRGVISFTNMLLYVVLNDKKTNITDRMYILIKNRCYKLNCQYHWNVNF